MDRRSFIRFTGGVGVGAATGLAGCLGGGSSNGDGGTTEEPSSNTETSDNTTTSGGSVPSSEVAVSHYPAITVFSAMVGARDQGLFEENGMTISEIVSFSGGGATVRGLTTGGIGIGGAALSAGVKAYQSGSPLKIIGLYLSSTDIEFHTRPDESFSSIQDLQGEKVGVSTPGSSGEAALIRAVQEAEEITLDDIDITYTGGLGESQTQLSEGAVAASWTLQPVATQTINNNETKRVFKAREYVDHYTQFALAASDKMLNENRELVEAYVRGIADGHSFAKENPEEAARAWAEVADIPDQLAVDSVHAMEPDVMYNITPQREILTSTARAMIEQGAISEQPDWDSIVDQSVLPESLRADDF